MRTFGIGTWILWAYFTFGEGYSIESNVGQNSKFSRIAQLELYYGRIEITGKAIRDKSRDISFKGTNVSGKSWFIKICP